ncbi:MAG: SulP family inorganic anion transporter [Caldilineaceae bacterium]
MLAGSFRLGFLLKFVCSVMVGFITGIALLIIMGQVGDFTGYSSPFQNKILQDVGYLAHFDQFNIPTFAVGLATVGLIYRFGRTKLRRVALILALIVATLLPLIFGWEQVLLVRDIADIPALPKPYCRICG